MSTIELTHPMARHHSRSQDERCTTTTGHPSVAFHHKEICCSADEPYVHLGCLLAPYSKWTTTTEQHCDCITTATMLFISGYTHRPQTVRQQFGSPYNHWCYGQPIGCLQRLAVHCASVHRQTARTALLASLTESINHQSKLSFVSVSSLDNWCSTTSYKSHGRHLRESVKVVLIIMALCLTVSSCQTFYSVSGHLQPRFLLSESRNRAVAKQQNDTEWEHSSSSLAVHSQPIITSAHTIQVRSLSLTRYQHANRLKKRIRRSNKSSNRIQNSKSFNRKRVGSESSANKHAMALHTVRLAPSLTSFVPSLIVPKSPKLTNSMLVSKMKPPYVSTAMHGPQANTDHMSSSNNAATMLPRNITAQVGHPAYLHCLVESLGDKMVSWIRLRDFHLLTIGSLTYIQDDRFAVRPASHSTIDWSLQIKHVTVKDEGLYECQVNSDPPRSQYYYLHVVVPVSEIAGNPDIFVRSGSPINLTCLISSSPEPPAFVFWYHNDRMINYDYNTAGNGQISVQKDPKRNDVIISRLLINKAQVEDSGNYTCSPSNAESASSYVHVLQGEKRMSNQIQNDWSQTELQANNEGHHSSQQSRFLLTTRSWNLHMVALAVVLLSRLLQH